MSLSPIQWEVLPSGQAGLASQGCRTSGYRSGEWRWADFLSFLALIHSYPLMDCVAAEENLEGRGQAATTPSPSDIWCGFLPTYPPALGQHCCAFSLGEVVTQASPSLTHPSRGHTVHWGLFNCSKMKIPYAPRPLGPTSPMTFCSKKHGKRKMLQK